MYKILKTDGRAKRAEFTTVHGTVHECRNSCGH